MGWFDSTYQKIAPAGDFLHMGLPRPQGFVLKAQRALKTADNWFIDQQTKDILMKTGNIEHAVKMVKAMDEDTAKDFLLGMIIFVMQEEALRSVKIMDSVTTEMDKDHNLASEATRRIMELYQHAENKE